MDDFELGNSRKRHDEADQKIDEESQEDDDDVLAINLMD